MLTINHPARVAVLCSRRAPGLVHLLERAASSQAFTIVGVITSEPEFAELEAVSARGIPVVRHDIRAFYASRSASLTRNWAVRAAYDAETVQALQTFTPDLVLLDGYLYLLTAAVLDAFPNRLLNLHFSDLSLREADSRPTFPGIRAVRDAIVAGLKETCATVHLVDSEPDGGAPLVRSWAFPVSPLVERARTWQATDMLKAYAYAHQEWMLRDASGPLLEAALELVTSGRVSLDALGSHPPHTAVPWALDWPGTLTPPAPASAEHRDVVRPSRSSRRRAACDQAWTRRREAESGRAAIQEDGAR